MGEQTQSAPTLCRMGCGFFGSSATEGMCSQCFRDYQHRKQEQSTNSTSATNTSSSSSQNANHNTNSHQIQSAGSSGPSTLNEAMKERDFSEAWHMVGQATPLSDLPASPQAMPTLEEDTALPKTPKKNRCFLCRKKVGLTGFHCRCGEQFCALHRYADKHNCSFDYKTSGREELQRKHPKVVASKVQKL